MDIHHLLWEADTWTPSGFYFLCLNNEHRRALPQAASQFATLYYRSVCIRGWRAVDVVKSNGEADDMARGQLRFHGPGKGAENVRGNEDEISAINEVQTWKHWQLGMNKKSEQGLNRREP